MTVDAATLPDYAGKKVALKLQGDFAGVYEGKVEASSMAAMAFKPNGQPSMIIDATDILEIEAAATKPKKLVVKELSPVNEDTVRQHLIDRHGYPVASIEQYDPAQALEWHDTALDHTVLGHNHNKGTEAAAPVAAAATA